MAYHLYFDIPPAIFKARINMSSIVYPVTDLTFDGVTLGAYTDLIPDHTLLLGTTEGGDDLGRVRVQKFATSTSIAVGRISQGNEDGTLDVQDNAYITVLDDYRPWAKIPRMILDNDPETPDVDTFKDSDIAVGNNNDFIPPKANCGPFFADYVDPITGLITVQFPMGGTNESFANAEGATIVTYLWDVEDGTLTVGTTASAVITATFPAGRRWVGLTVTDSNGKVHTSRTFVLAVEIDEDEDVTYKDWASITFNQKIAGQQVDIKLNDYLLRTSGFIDGCLVLVWEDEPLTPGDRSHMKFVGWHQTESWELSGTRKGLARGTTLHCVDVAGALEQLPGFPQALERSEDEGWEYMPDLTMNRALNNIIAWHTTIYSLADVILPVDGNDYNAMRLDTSGGNIFDQMNNTSRKMVPRHLLTCTPEGRLIFLEDWMEVDVADRPVSALTIMEDDTKEIRAQYNRQAKAHSLSAGAILSSTDWVVIGGVDEVPLVFSKAPGDVFSQGTSELIESEGLALSQEDLNDATGHRYARHNARYAPFNIQFANKGNVWDYVPALMQRVELEVASMYHAWRGLDFTSAFGMVKDQTIILTETKQGTRIQSSLNWERETSGSPGITQLPEDLEIPEPTEPVIPEPTVPPGIPEGEDLVAGIGYDGFIYRTEDFTDATPTWDEVDTGIADTIYSWVVDPFSPGYLTGVGFINGWIVNDTAIYRVEDIFDTVVVTSVLTFPVATSGASFHWRTIQASFGAYFAAGVNPWLLCVSYYGNTAGHTGTWACRSTNGGVTWSAEVQISAEYEASAQSRFNPVAVFTSPRTPGLAYTAAHVSVAGGPLPNWGIWRQDEADFVVLGLSASASATSSAASVGAGVVENDRTLILAPPPNTARIVCECTWSATITEAEPATPITTTSLAVDNPGTLGRTDDLVYTAPDVGSGGGTDLETGAFTVEWTFGGGDWPVNTTTIISAPPTGPGTGARFEPHAKADADAIESCSASVTISATVTEIELDGGFTYTPVDTEVTGFVSTDWGETWEPFSVLDAGAAQAGTIHLPWEGNLLENLFYHGTLQEPNTREFRLKKILAGVVSDISPTDGFISYGVNRGSFGVRAYDSDSQYVVASVIGNDTSADPDDDQHAVYISDDIGATWDEVVAPIADTGAPTNRPAFEAAFSGDNPDAIFIWGPAAYMGYSDDFGVTVQDKSGNLAALGSVGFIGIAGGPHE